MEFFNKKEEVLEIKLTNYGKDRLAAGQLNPTYYAFFDDDVLYDAAAAGFSEDQNNTEPRIQSNTPQTKLITTREGAETRVNQFLNAVSSSFIGGHTSDPADNVQAFQQQTYDDKGKIDAYPLGRSSLDKEVAPAWQLQLLSNPSASVAQRFLNEDDYIQPIPQIDITIDYETFFQQGDQTANSISGYLGDSNLFLALEENYLMVELMEENTEFEKSNFELEVFQSSSSGYTQLSYTAESDTEFVVSTVDNIEYFMNVLTDKEIPLEVYQQLNINEAAILTNATRVKFNRDLYTTDNEEPC